MLRWDDTDRTAEETLTRDGRSLARVGICKIVRRHAVTRRNAIWATGNHQNPRGHLADLPCLRSAPFGHSPGGGRRARPVTSAKVSLWQGQQSLQTTDMYLRPNLAQKLDILSEWRSLGFGKGRFTGVKDEPLAMLASI